MAQLIKIGKKYYSDLRINGKRIRRALSSDKRFAEEKLLELMKWRGSQQEGSRDGDISWELFKERYVESISWKVKNTQTIDKLAIRYFDETFPIRKLSQFTPELLEAARNRWIGRFSKNYINRLISALKAMMRIAEKWKLSPKHDWESVAKLKTTKARKYFWLLEQLSQLLQLLPEPYKTTLYLGGLAGLRLSEARYLAWSDIDFNLKRLHITPKEDWNPKDYEKRTIPMPIQLIAHLQSLPRASIYVLGEHQMTGQVLSAMMSRLIKRASFKGTAHTARHTYASHLVMSGVPIYTVSKLLGHASVKTTEEHYAHLAASHIDAEVAKFPQLVLQ